MNLRSKIPFFLASIKRDTTQPIWLEYLQSDSNAFIDTGVSGNNNNLSLNVTFYIEKFFEYGAIFGNYIDEASNVFRVICAENTSRIYFNANTRCSNATAKSTNSGFFGSKHTLRLEKTKLTVDGVASSIANINGTVNNTNIALFNRSATNPFTNVRDVGLKIYSCQMYDGGVMIRDFRPCLHPKTLQPCMYDMVTKQYFFNAGTGQFNYEYTFDTLEYLESTGTQWIDTGIATTNSDFGFTLDAMPLTSSDTYPVGSRASDAGKRFFGIRSNSSSTFAYGWQWYKTSEASQSYVNVRTQMSLNWLNAKQASIGNDVAELQDAVIDNGSNISLFGVSGGLLWKGRIYSATISKGYQVVADYIPVRKLDGTVCMYDFISGEFKVNSGSGTFVAGGYVQNLEDYEKLDYLTFTGTQQLKTDVNWKDVYGFSGGSQGNSAMYATNRAVLGSAGYSSANDSYGVRFSGATREWQWNTGIAVEEYVKYSFTKQDGMWVGNVNDVESTISAESVLAQDTGVQIGASQNTRRFIGDIYTQVLFDVDGKPLLIAQPVKRKSDGVKGMLDMVSGAFLTNQGTGEFE